MSTFASGFHYGQLTLAFIIFIVALQVALLIPRLRPHWLEVELAVLILFGFAVFFATPVTTPLLPNTSAAPFPCSITPTPTTKSSATASPTPTPVGAFLLPADKIKTDLKAFQSHDSWNNISLLLVVDKSINTYNATICNTSGIGNDTPNPPYSNDLVKVIVHLQNDSDTSTLITFAKDLASTSAIYILPHSIVTPTPTTLVSLQFSPSFSKLRLSHSCLNTGSNVEIVLITADNQTYSSPASLSFSIPNMPNNTCLSNQSPGTTLVTVTLNNVTQDAAATFDTELTNATAIYLIQK